jgi:hypothetical protein
MDFTEIINLIKIREYVANATALPAIERKTVTQLNDYLLLIDKKLIGMLQTTKFKEYININDLQATKQNAVKITNIYTDIKDRK